MFLESIPGSILNMMSDCKFGSSWNGAVWVFRSRIGGIDRWVVVGGKLGDGF